MTDGSRIVFMGSPEFAVPSLTRLAASYCVPLVVTQPDQPAGRGRRLAASPVKQAAQDLTLEVLEASRFSADDEAVRLVKEAIPDVVVVAAFGALLPKHVLALPRYGCVNVHASLLPRHRGAAPIPAAILAGDVETGVTIMLMDEGLDTGPILHQVACPIQPQDTTETLTLRLAGMGAEALLETLPRWMAGSLQSRPQDRSLATYAPQLTKGDGDLDWSKPAQRLAREVRAYYPWPGSFTHFKGRRVKVLQAAAVTQAHPGAAVGEVVWWEDNPAVTTGQGTLVLVQVQPAGKGAMDARAFCQGYQEFIGGTLPS